MIKQTIQNDQITALKSGDKKKLETLRYILAKIKNKEIEKRVEPTDEEVLDILRKQVKELKESIDSFEKGNRPDLAAEYKGQLELIAVYLPKELSDEDLKHEVDRIIAANQDLYNKNAKAIIGLCMKELKNKAESSRILQMIEAR
ncbi:MAG: hypothetical protein RI947_762 [Candidatus Parcubacteria bacterium]|jgi:uncharacterized protein YqeY